MELSSIYSFDNLFNSFEESRSTRTKAKYDGESMLSIYSLSDMDFYKTQGLYPVHINRKGRIRDINAPHMEERFVQRCFVQNCLFDIFKKSAVSGNILGNGYGFDQAYIKTRKDITTIYKHYGTDAYVLVMDFKQYFDNIDPDKAIEILFKGYENNSIINQTKEFIYGQENGIPFGSPTAQCIAIFYPKLFDHYIVEKLGIKQFTRYLDDSYIMHHSKEYLEECLDKLNTVCEKNHIKLNNKKTKICKITDFEFLKIRFQVSDTGKIYTSIEQQKIKSYKKKFNALYEKYNSGELDIDYIKQVYKSTMDYLSYGNKKTIRQFKDFLYTLFTREEILCITR